MELDNITLTTHIAGTTKEALTSSPGLLMEDIQKLLEGRKPRFIVNPQILENSEFKQWLTGIQS